MLKILFFIIGAAPALAGAPLSVGAPECSTAANLPSCLNCQKHPDFPSCAQGEMLPPVEPAAAPSPTGNKAAKKPGRAAVARANPQGQTQAQAPTPAYRPVPVKFKTDPLSEDQTRLSSESGFEAGGRALANSHDTSGEHDGFSARIKNFFSHLFKSGASNPP